MLSFIQILRSVTGQELNRKSLLQSCLQHLLQYFSGEGFTQGKYQGFILNEADLQAVKPTFLRSQGRLPSLWDRGSHFVVSGVTPAHTSSSAFPSLGLGHYTQNKRKKRKLHTVTHCHGNSQAAGPSTGETIISHTLLTHIPHPRHWKVCVGRGRKRCCSHPSSWTTAAPHYC